MTAPVRPEATSAWEPPAHSLEYAAAQLEKLDGLLSAPPEKEEAKQPPEQSPTTEDTPSNAAASATEQASAAPVEESEQTESTQGEESEAPPTQPDVRTVKLDGKDVPVTYDEALKGYLRLQDYTRKTMQVSEQRKANDAELQAARAERSQYLNGLTQIEQAMKELSPAEPNWELLKQRLTPDQFADQMLNWRTTQQRLQTIAAEKARVQALQQQDAAREFKTRLEQEQELLTAALPEFADPTSGPALKSSLYSFAKGQGFSDDQISSATTDHKVVLILHKAMLYDQAQAKKPAVANKIEKVIATPAPGNRQPAPPKSKYDSAMSRLKQSGSIEDAGKAIESLFGS